MKGMPLCAPGADPGFPVVTSGLGSMIRPRPLTRGLLGRADP